MDEDKELYRDYLENYSAEAINKLMSKYRADLIHFVNRMVNDYFAAEDISQEVFVYLLQHRDVYDFQYSFKTYLFRIAQCRAINYMKSKKREYCLSEESKKLYTNYLCKDEEDNYSEENKKVFRTLKKLKKEYQMVIYLVDLEEMSYEEVGIIMERSLSQIKSLVHNARKRVKELIEREEQENLAKLETSEETEEKQVEENTDEKEEDEENEVKSDETN